MPVDGPFIKPGLGPPIGAARPWPNAAVPSSGGGTAVVVGGVELTGYLKDRSLTLKHNTFDFVLIDPVDGLPELVAPSLGDIVHVYEPAWTGVVSGIKQADVKRGSTRFFAITATNTDAKYATPAPFGLSDVPDGATTYGYADLSMSQARTSSGDETRGSLVVYAEGLWPAMTFTLTSANFALVAQEFSVSDVTVTWPKKGEPVYKVDFGDALVTLSAWAVGVATDSILPITTTKITDGAVTTPKVAANAITASTIAAGAITADKLVATLILTTLITSGTTGARWEADEDGIRLFDANDGLLFNAPTDGSPVIVAGQITADSLVVTGNSEFQGTGNQFSQASSTTLQAGVQAPTAAPSLVQGWPSGSSLLAGAYGAATLSGGHYDTAGGADGATACWLVLAYLGGTVYVLEFKTSDGSLDRATPLSGISTLSFTAGHGFITRVGTKWYVNVTWSGTGTPGIFSFTRSTGAYAGDAVGGTIGDALATDGTFVYNLVLVGATYYLLKLTSALAFDSLNALVTLPSGYTGTDTMTYADIGGGGRFWIGDVAHGNILEVNAATYTVVANTEFPTARPLGVGNGFIWDGTQFQHNQYVLGGASVRKYTSWTWTVASAIYWVGYAWYDSAGTTHETVIGPRRSITMGRRKQLIVGNAAIPVGGADDPNQVRVYMLPNATDPGAGAFKLQSTDALTTRTLLTYASGGAADGGGTPFVGGIGAVLKAASTGWLFRGNGSMNLGSATFPTSPVENDVYHRTDYDMDFTYNGAVWMSRTQFNMRLDSFDALAASRASTGIGPAPTTPGSDILLDSYVVQFLVNGGTALSASHSWIGTFNKQPTGNTDTLVATVTINSGSSSVWRTSTSTLGVLLNNGTLHFDFTDAWTKTGTPGTLFVRRYLLYRYIAT